METWFNKFVAPSAIQNFHICFVNLLLRHNFNGEISYMSCRSYIHIQKLCMDVPIYMSRIWTMIYLRTAKIWFTANYADSCIIYTSKHWVLHFDNKLFYVQEFMSLSHSLIFKQVVCCSNFHFFILGHTYGFVLTIFALWCVCICMYV